MGKERMTVRIWVASLATCALVLTVAELHAAPPTLDAWAALLLLSVCAAISTFAPIKSGVDGGSLRLISVFAIACVAVLPRGLLGPFAALAVLPDLWVRRHRPRGRLLLGMAFNASQTALAELDRCAGGQLDPAVVSAVHRIANLHGSAFFTDPVHLPPRDDDHASDTDPSGVADRMLSQVLR